MNLLLSMIYRMLSNIKFDLNDAPVFFIALCDIQSDMNLSHL